MREQPAALPSGTYVSLATALRLNMGGRTAVMLMRARAIAEFGQRSVIATVSDQTDLDHVRTVLSERGELTDGIEVVSLYEHYRTRTPTALGEGRGPALTPPPDLVATVETYADGRPHRTTYRSADADADAEPALIDYQRDDGSVYFRWTVVGLRSEIDLVDHHGRVIEHFLSRTRLLRRWMRELVGDGEGFVVTDSRVQTGVLAGLSSRRIHVLSAFHNPHTADSGRWDAPLKPQFGAVLDELASLDALVLLTERQRDEVALRFGRTDNLYAVPNPVVPPSLPDPMPPRDLNRLVVVARLEGQKRVGHTLRAVARASKVNPDLRLDVYGDGKMRPQLEKQAAKLGIDHAVTFHGYDPAARDRILTASAFLVGSQFEGYPLATLEAMSRGCPVISYDIKFGPREQITDGVDGYLVPDGDIKTYARRILDATSDADHAAAMSRAALAKAGEHSPARFAAEWAEVFRTVAERSATRVALADVRLQGVRIRGGQLSARLRLAVTGPSPAVGDATVSLDVIGEETGEVVSTPVTVRPPRAGLRVDGLRLRVTLDDDNVAQALGDQPVRLRLLLVWRNASWQQEVGHGAVEAGQLRWTRV